MMTEQMISEDLNHVLLRQQNRFKLVIFVEKLSILLQNMYDIFQDVSKN